MRLPAWPLLCLALGAASSVSGAAELPALLGDAAVRRAHPLPDFSYAGYAFGARELPAARGQLVDAAEFGVIADDGLDDSQALKRALAAAHAVDGPVIMRLPPGRIELSEVLFIERGHFVLEGHGSGAGGTELYMPRPLSMINHGQQLEELRSYLQREDKRQVEPQRNIDLPFSEYSWSGGFLWVQRPGSRPYEYIEQHAKDPGSALESGRAFTHEVRLAEPGTFRQGDLVRVIWRPSQGKDSPLLQSLYGGMARDSGSRHWEDPQRQLVVQITRIESASGKRLTLADPLLHDIRSAQPATIEPWEGLQEVGIRDLALRFPPGVAFGHHLEAGFNGIYLNDVFNGWVRSVRIIDADSGILTYNSAATTLADIVTEGERRAHYAVHIGNVHGLLVTGLRISNPVVHSLSFNTRSTRSVFHDALLTREPVLDQHAGANHQNLFDQVVVRASARRDAQGPFYPLWDGSGAGYWQPGHGRYNTTWNLRFEIEGGAAPGETVRILGLDEGPDARVVGLHGNRPLAVDYRPAPYIEWTNRAIDAAPSLYRWQLAQRRTRAKAESAE